MRCFDSVCVRWLVVGVGRVGLLLSAPHRAVHPPSSPSLWLASHHAGQAADVCGASCGSPADIFVCLPSAAIRAPRHPCCRLPLYVFLLGTVWGLFCELVACLALFPGLGQRAACMLF